MSDAAFNAVLGQIDDFSLLQKRTLIKALKKSVSKSLVFHKSKARSDLKLVESFVGVAGSNDISISQIKEERLTAE